MAIRLLAYLNQELSNLAKYSKKLAKHLYEKNGFVVEGIKRDAMFVDGNYVDEYYMAKLL